MPHKRKATTTATPSLACGLPGHVLAEVFSRAPLDLVSVVLTCKAWKKVVRGDRHLRTALSTLRSWRGFPRAELDISPREISPHNWPPNPPMNWLLDDAGLAVASATLGTFARQVDRYRVALLRGMRKVCKEDSVKDFVEVWQRLAPRFRVGIDLDPVLPNEGGPAMGLSMGSSKFNGLPDFPGGSAVVWPRGEEEGAPMKMLLQIRCADLGHVDAFGVFPEHGLLQFWHCDEGSHDFPAMYHAEDDPATLLPGKYPDDSQHGPYGREAGIRMSALIMPPHGLFEDDCEGHSESPLRKYEEVIAESARVPRHWLLGNCYPIQGNPVPENCVMLCQVCSDDDLGFMFGDLGDIYWTLSTEELAAGKWDHADSEMQDN